MQFPSRRSALRRMFRTALPFLLLAAPAGATSYVRVEDGALADQSSVVAEVRVESVEPTPAGRIPGTDYLVTLERTIKGFAPGSSILVRVPGGVRADGKGLKLWGMPEFRAGDRALLFLVEHQDGSYGILHLLLGAFHVLEVDGREVALRDLSQATEVRREAGGGLATGAGEDQPRDLAPFTAWLEDRGRGVARPADYFVTLPKSVLSTLAGKFTLFTSGVDNLRWFDFDSGGSVPFYADANGQPGVPGGGFAELQRAIASWDQVALPSPIRYTYAGTTTARGGLKTYDGINAILFDDPNQEIDGTFSCASGGILGVGGPWYDGAVTGTFAGRTFVRIQGADIIINDGIACFFTQSQNVSKAAEELFGHELGHTLGLAHSCGDSKSPACSTDPLKNDALMRTFIHDDGRGARIAADDLAGIRQLYAPTVATGPCRGNATTLCLDGRRFKVELVWTNQFDGSSGLGRAVPATDATGYFSFGDPANLELLIKVLDFGGGTFKVFYGELTNLHFVLTVTDTQTGQVKTYANTAGDCGGIDQSFTGASIAAADRAGRAAELSAGGSAASGSCRPDANRLCLLNGRFAVEVSWQNPGNGTSGAGGAAALSGYVGTFFFTDPGNVELMTKVIPFPDRVVFFYGALTDLAYTIQVTDTLGGAVKTYRSTPGTLCGGLDNSAF